MALISFKKPKPHKTREGKIGLTLAAHSIDTIIDIGANNGGAYESFRNGGFKGQIISIDPLPAVQETLAQKKKNDPNWTILPPLAIGDQNGETQINVSDASDMSSVLKASNVLMEALPRTNVVETITVQMKTLDTLYEELCLEGKNVFVKIDTQGYEMPILKHAEKTLNKIKGLQVEMSLFELYEGETLYGEIMTFLSNKGFSPHMLIETNFSKKLNRQLQIDGIFYKD